MKKIIKVTDNRKTYVVAVCLFAYLAYTTITDDPIINEVVIGAFGLMAVTIRAGIGKNGARVVE